VSSLTSWWGGRSRQFRAHVRASVRPQERLDLAAWTTDHQRAVFDAMHVADQRHGLDVVRTLREHAVSDPDLLLAGLLHDAGKGDTGVWPRVAWTLGERFGAWIPRTAAFLPGFRAALERLGDHADTSAELARAAGCTDRTVELIRRQASPPNDRSGELLRLADEAN